MATLFAIVAEDDPFLGEPEGGKGSEGPILRALSACVFDRLVLLFPPGFQSRADVLAHQCGGPLTVERHPIPLPGAALGIASDLLDDILTSSSPDDSFLLPRSGPYREALLRRPAADGNPSLCAPGPDGQLIRLAPARSAAALHEPPAAYGAGLPALRAGEDPLVMARDLGLVGDAPGLHAAIRTAAAVAAHRVPLLVLGETGTGKTLLARFVHALSGRRGRFVAVNCGALPEALAESILFGHRKGAFTGAVADQAGKFEQADGGTLFLDEIGELPPALQPKLLRAVEDHAVEPIGATQPRAVDVRVIAATHRDLRRMIAEKAFREDLYFRLAYATMRLPALRERREDIAALSASALDKINASLRHPRRLTSRAIRRLESQPWPGNIRELENVIGRSALLALTGILDAADLLMDGPAPADPISGLPEPSEGFRLEDFLSDARRQLILRALDRTAGNQSAAARLLGISPQAVHKFVHAANRG